MSRIILQLSNAKGPGGAPTVSIALVPKDVDSEEVPFTCSVAEDIFQQTMGQVLDGEAIKVAGSRLFSAVSEHPDIHAKLQAALSNQAESPIYVWFATKDGVELLPWEAMCSPDGEFLGLDERWALGRMATSRVGASVHTFEPPIRIAAVLSCLGITAAGELAALRVALASASASASASAPAPVELLVLSSEEQLVTQLQAEIDDGQAPGVRVELIPPDLEILQTRVREFKPHVLHFFCHGSVAGGPHIQLAVKSDWEAASPGSGLTAEAEQFKDFRKDGDELWLIVLNCCEGAAPGTHADGQSLALALIRAGHVPAAVAMREPVVNKIAESVTSSLYAKLVAELGERLVTPGVPEPFEWARLIVAARDKLARSHNGLLRSQAAATTKEWTLPVVYVSPDPFHLQVRHRPVVPPPHAPGPAPPGGAGFEPNDEQDREARLEIQALELLLRSLPPRQGDDLRSDAVARMHELAARLHIQLSPTP